MDNPGGAEPSPNSVGGDCTVLPLSLAEQTLISRNHPVEGTLPPNMSVAGPSSNSVGGDDTVLRLSLAEHTQEEKISYRSHSDSDEMNCLEEQIPERIWPDLEACKPDNVANKNNAQQENLEATLPEQTGPDLQERKQTYATDRWEQFCGMRECQDFIKAAKEAMKMECEECGDGLDEDDLEMCILGLDVVGLFPAMKSKNSGAILRRQSVKGPLKVRGFKWRHGARYIRVN